MAKTTAKRPQPGDRYKQGTVCKITDDGVYIGREAEADEALPAEHSEHTFGERRVFLSDHQGPINPAILDRA